MALRSEGQALQTAESLRADVLALLREKRYEEALVTLYRARSETPDDAQLQKSIDKVKEFLVGVYAKRLGGLDRVAAPLPTSKLRSPDSVLLARYVDGRTTFDDVTQMCPLGKLRTLQVLVGLYADGEPPRIEHEEAPSSGVRAPSEPAAPSASINPEGDDAAPDTARSASVAAAMRALEGRTSGGAPTTTAGDVAPSPSTPQPAYALPYVPPQSAREKEEARQYAEFFAQGTTAFVQRRYEDAVSAFQACLKLRSLDNAADVMLRRSLCDLGSRVG